MSGPAINESIKYHSPYRTGVYDGTILSINKDGTVAIEVLINGIGVMTLMAVSYGPKARARPISSERG